MKTSNESDFIDRHLPGILTAEFLCQWRIYRERERERERKREREGERGRVRERERERVPYLERESPLTHICRDESLCTHRAHKCTYACNMLEVTAPAAWNLVWGQPDRRTIPIRRFHGTLESEMSASSSNSEFNKHIPIYEGGIERADVWPRYRYSSITLRGPP